jgi:hypothetical protein
MTNVLYAFYISPVCAACPSHPILRDLIKIISGEKNKFEKCRKEFGKLSGHRPAL